MNRHSLPRGPDAPGLPVSETTDIPDILRKARDSQAGRKTSLRKLNGQVYTPLAVAQRMLDLVAWPAGEGCLLDPACGDGVFLEAAMRKAASHPDAREVITRRVRGWDLDADALAAARTRLEAVARELDLPGALPRLEHRDALEARSSAIACVVGNPPYLEAKRMPDALKDRIRAVCPLSSRGAFDLYAAFIEHAHHLCEGEICLIVPNRLLVLDSLKALRLHLLRTRRVEILDLSRERIFQDAAVYPVILHTLPGSGYHLLAREVGSPPVELPLDVVLERLDGRMPVAPSHPAGCALLARVLREPAFQPMGRMLEIRWCVSFHREGLRERFVFPPDMPKSPLARPFLGGGPFMGNREVDACRIDWQGWWIDWDPERARREKNPFPPSEVFAAPKVVLCQNARRARAALDQEGFILKDTFLSLRPQEGLFAGNGEVWLAWIVLVLHSDLFHYLYEHLYGGTRKGGGFLHFLPTYLDPFPVPSPPPEASRIHEALMAGQDVQAEAEALVQAAWGVTPAEREALRVAEIPPRTGQTVG